ncbi:Ubiquitin domain-containing protein UBFD1 [Sarcoptes scabiei]|uniref:Ubiquitin domain-containing protein UBFD1 n=1 Tax=Sarcoptes scabiei TaxID=52283 RepID=A0A834VC93_SARSC|nr:Ubiquitin domain-containing protein UBFD1 [Sarcoptes scabiei]
MTLDESEKHPDSNGETTNNSLEPKTESINAIQSNSNSAVDEINKVGAKRTFDQISESSIQRNESVVLNDLTLEKNDQIESNSTPSVENLLNFKVIYAKEIFEITLSSTDTISKLKNYLQTKTNVPETSQKLCYKGILVDNKSLEECGIKNGTKIMLIGSKADEILTVTSASKNLSTKETKESSSIKESLCQQKMHKKIIDKGLPENAMSAWINDDCPLPTEPLTGMLNKYGNKVRLTFKLEQDELWISTKERTQKIQMTSIKSVISEPIDDFKNYHIMALQIGPTEASRIWFYWVPAQYIRAIKNIILNS